LELSKSLLLFTVDTISPKRIVKTCTVETSASLLEAYDAFALGTRVIYDSLAIDPRRLVATTECPEIRNAMSADLTTTILSPHTKQLSSEFNSADRLSLSYSPSISSTRDLS